MPEPISLAERDAIAREIAELEAFRDIAVSITENAKGRILIPRVTAESVNYRFVCWC